MKKYMYSIVAFLAAIMIPISVSAEESGVWNEITVSEDSLVVEVKAASPVADGYFEIKYDANKLSVDKEDVVFNEAIKYSSVNVEDSMVIVAIVSTEAFDEGVVFSVKFKPVTAGEELSKDMVTFYGEANDANGEPIKTTSEAEKQRDVGQTAENKPVDEAEGPNSGMMIAGIVLLAAALLLVISLFIRKKFAK